MSRFVIFAVLLLLAIGLTAQTTTAPTPAPDSPNQLTRIMEPREGAKIAGTVVTVRFDVTEQAAADGTPEFHVQLDADDPVETTDLEYTFTGVSPGPHTVTVEMVDANETPIAGSRAQVRFIVTGQRAASEEVLPPTSRPRGTGHLVALALVGFGMLVAGAIYGPRAR